MMNVLSLVKKFGDIMIIEYVMYLIAIDLNTSNRISNYTQEDRKAETVYPIGYT